MNDLQESGATNTSSGNNTASLTFDQLLNMTYTQINSSQVLLQIAINAGYSSIDEMIPGLEMFWEDVSMRIVKDVTVAEMVAPGNSA
jgi:hypothetical protein